MLKRLSILLLTGVFLVPLYGQVYFDSDRNVGHPPLIVNFYNHCSKADNPAVNPDSIYWDLRYGGGQPDDRKLNGPNATACYWEQRSHSIWKGVRSSTEQTARNEFVHVYEPNGYAPLEFLEGSPTSVKYTWENAVDGDISCWDGVVEIQSQAGGRYPYAIFKFPDNEVKNINKIRVKTDGKVGYSNRWIRRFKVSVSDGQTSRVYRSIVDGILAGGDWNVFRVEPPVPAKFIKFEVTDAIGGARLLTEFEVYEDTEIPSPDFSTLKITSPHFADGADAAEIQLRLFDKNGKPIGSYNQNDIQFYLENCATGDFGPINCVLADSGLYKSTLTMTSPGTYRVKAVVHGAVINNDITGDNKTPTFVEFYGYAGQEAELTFYEGSETFVKHPWENLTDGDLTGWDGTVTVDGAEPTFAAFHFPNFIKMPINKVYLKTDNGADDDRYLYRQYYDIELLVSNDYQNWKSVFTTSAPILNYQWFRFPTVFARYIKLQLNGEPNHKDGWKQIVEFEVQFDSKDGFDFGQETVQVAELAKDFTLQPAFPNPFNPTTTISFQVPQETHVRLEIYNTLGQRLEVLVDNQVAAGQHQVTWNASRHSSGIYLYRFTAGGFTETRQLLLMK